MVCESVNNIILNTAKILVSQKGKVSVDDIYYTILDAKLWKKGVLKEEIRGVMGWTKEFHREGENYILRINNDWNKKIKVNEGVKQ